MMIVMVTLKSIEDKLEMRISMVVQLMCIAEMDDILMAMEEGIEEEPKMIIRL